MKSILIGLLLILWIQSFPAYTQTETEVYCLPIDKARLLIADAMRLRLADSIANNRSARIVVLEQQIQSTYQSFTNLLKIEQEKLSLQKEITLHTESISNTYQEEKASLKKQVRRLKWQRAGLGVIAVLVIVLAL